MKVNYTNHLENRLKLRQIDHDIPERIYNESRERYYDSETGHHIAVSEVEMYGKIRDVALAYRVESDSVWLLTIHPLKKGQRESRVQTGRWRKVE